MNSIWRLIQQYWEWIRTETYTKVRAQTQRMQEHDKRCQAAQKHAAKLDLAKDKSESAVERTAGGQKKVKSLLQEIEDE